MRVWTRGGAAGRKHWLLSESLCFSVSASCLPRERMVEDVLITGPFECLKLTPVSEVNNLCK